jgi:uncharacterized protein (DUF58 family)
MQPSRQSIPYLDPLVVSRLKTLELKARFIVEGFITGLHKSPYHGFSVEFAEHRPYNTGEPLRSIDWKVYGKTGKLYTKRFEEETNLRGYVVLDVSDSMRYPESTGKPNEPLSKLEYGAYLAAALSYLMIRQRDAAGFAFYDETVQYYVPPKARFSRLVPIFQSLEQIVAQKDRFSRRTATPKVLHELAQKMGRRGLVVLITDLFGDPTQGEALFPALQHLRHLNHEVLVYQLMDHSTEGQFEFGSHQPLLLKDLETGEELRVQPEQIRQAYQERMTAWRGFLRRKCRELNIELVEADIRQPYEKLLLDYLIKRRTLLG